MTVPSSNSQRSWKITSSTHDVIRIPNVDGKAFLHLTANVKAVAFISAKDLDVILEDGASLELLRCFDKDVHGPYEISMNARQGKDTSLKALLLTKGSSVFKDQISISLQGPGAHVSLNGLHNLSGDACAESSTLIDHCAPSTSSNQLYKSIVRDSSHSVYNGKIMVRREAQLTNAYQLNKNLILGPAAYAQTKPILEIFADDVKCSHGATIGQLDDDQLFYFQTRGINSKEAKDMLIKGFTEDIISNISDSQLRAEVGGLL